MTRIGLAGILALVLAAGPAAAQSPLARPFELLDTGGRPVTDRMFRGQWLLVFFGFTHCPDVCPTAMVAIAALLDRLGPLAANVRPIFVTVDPERDTPAELEAYLAAFDDRIAGLTGDADRIARAAAAFGARYIREPGAVPGEYTIAHSALIYVVGPEGGLVTQFNYAMDMDGMERTLRALLE